MVRSREGRAGAVPIRWNQVPDSLKSKIGNGCGPRSLPTWLSTFLNHFLFGWLFNASCRRHDFAYARGGSKVDRKASDVGLLKAMKQDIDRLPGWYQRYPAMVVCYTWYYLVRWFGWLFFNYGPYLSLDEILARNEQFQ